MSLEALIAENAKLREELARLQQENERLGLRNEELVKLVKELEARLAELEREQKRQAGPFRRREKLKVDPSQQKKRGRQPGHPGA